tara:strand:- start:758 stop:2296 length:1539 start_codon:yes stop_codon:yes gene_type:complete
MATTKVIPEVLDLNPGNPDYILDSTNAVTVINSGGNQYNFNGVYGKFGAKIGTITLTGVPAGHPIAFINSGKTSQISYTGTVDEGTATGPDGNTYTFYSGTVTLTVSADFGTISYYCKIHGYMGGQDNLVYTYSDTGLKMPSGTEVNRPTAVAGMVRNNTNESSNGGSSATEYYNGSAWQKISNDAPPPLGFKAVAYTGTGATNSITGLGFQPDIVWIKAVNQTYEHKWMNSLDGANYYYVPNSNDMRATTAGNEFLSFDSDGFSVGTATGWNGNGDNFVAWCWKVGAGGSTPQSNDETGISLVTYFGNQVSNRAIAHGLTTAPLVETVKKRSGGVNEFWIHLANPPMTGSGYVYRNSTDAFTLSGSPSVFGTLPDTTNFYVSNNTSSHDLTNRNGCTYINTLFAPIAKFSNFGTYTGATSGVSVNIGFTPDFIMIKNSSTSSTNWNALDTARNPSGALTSVLQWNTNAAATTLTTGITLTSDGFDIPATADITNEFNANGDTFSYMAFKTN